jgi:hypothetical protein
MLVGCWLGNCAVTEITYGLQLSLDAIIHSCCEVIASLHFLAVIYCCAGFSDANLSSVELDYILAVKLDLVADMVALVVASGYLLHCDTSLRCAQLLLGAGYLT